MRILVIGSGGREHALAWKLNQSPLAEEIFVAPGNGGTQEHNVPVSDKDIDGLVKFVQEKKIDFVVPGPELPLTLGITDAMEAIGIPCFGPSKACAKLEGSKAFSKEVMVAAGIPTAAYGTFQDMEKAFAFIDKHEAPLVIKADGLAAGKGVIIAQSVQEAKDAAKSMLGDKKFGDAGNTIIIEEFLAGEELSLLCFCDGETPSLCPPPKTIKPSVKAMWERIPAEWAHTVPLLSHRMKNLRNWQISRSAPCSRKWLNAARHSKAFCMQGL